MPENVVNNFTDFENFNEYGSNIYKTKVKLFGNCYQNSKF